MKIIMILIFSLVILIAFHACKIEDTAIDSGKVVSPKYHTSSNEGKWKDKSDTHVPLIKFISRDTIEVTVPLKPTRKPRHFIEVIALMQGKRTQVAVKKFTFSFNQAKAVFRLPDPDSKDYWILSKCNVHDMWKKNIIPAKK